MGRKEVIAPSAIFNFSILSEGDNSPFTVFDKSIFERLRTKSFAERIEFQSNSELLCSLLGVSGLRHIPAVLNDPLKKERAKEIADSRIGQLFGFSNPNKPGEEKNKAELADNVRELAALANGTIRLTESFIAPSFKLYFETANEVDKANHPVDLIALMLNTRYAERVRFEAKRKLALIMMGAAIRQTERELETDKKFSDFQTFVQGPSEADPVSPEGNKIGSHLQFSLLSTHRPDDFACIEVKPLTADELEGISFPLPEGTKLTKLSPRTFRVGKRDVPVYLNTRRKPDSSRILKLIRKDHTNPAAAIEDEVGAMGALASKRDIYLYLKHLRGLAKNSGTIMTIEEVEDTIDTGKKFSARNKGSSEKIEMFKFFARVNGVRVEIILHTFRTYLNSLYQDEVSHDEYQLRRFFQTGAAQLFYPESIYAVGHRKLEELSTQNVRRIARG